MARTAASLKKRVASFTQLNTAPSEVSDSDEELLELIDDPPTAATTDPTAATDKENIHPVQLETIDYYDQKSMISCTTETESTSELTIKTRLQDASDKVEEHIMYTILSLQEVRRLDKMLNDHNMLDNEPVNVDPDETELAPLNRPYTPVDEGSGMPEDPPVPPPQPMDGIIHLRNLPGDQQLLAQLLIMAMGPRKSDKCSTSARKMRKLNDLN